MTPEIVWKGLPKVVKVLGKRYKPLVVNKVDEDDSEGESDSESQEAKLRKGQGFEQARDTVLHEFMHAVEHQLGLEVPEQVIHQMATGILALMRDNPPLVKWLMAKEPKEQPTAEVKK